MPHQQASREKLRALKSQIKVTRRFLEMKDRDAAQGFRRIDVIERKRKDN